MAQGYGASEMTPSPEIEALALMGRCADGAERDSGTRYHAVPRGAHRAVCGAEPGRRSAGWSSHAGAAVTCARCVARLLGPHLFNPTRIEK
jgi:hypothetical protein